jgi:hypothetical protein
MVQAKEIMRLVVASFITVLITLTLTGAFSQNTKINDAATTDDLEKMETDVNEYTDKQIAIHEEKEMIRYTNFTVTLEKMYKKVDEMHDKIIVHEVKINDPAFKTRGEAKSPKYKGF